jgi:2,3-bisphosphoglycerate-dependent phosphoglycerate mutase
MRLLLLRHAESRPDHALPEADWPLSERGREQAQLLVEALAAVRTDHLFSSPFRRALDTIAPFALWSKRAVAVDPAFAECTLRTGYVPDWPAPVARAWADRTHADVGCESADACQTRVVAGIDALVRRHPRGRLLVCSHGNTIGLFLNAVEPTFDFAQWQAMTMPALYEVDVTARNFRAIRLPF